MKTVTVRDLQKSVRECVDIAQDDRGLDARRARFKLQCLFLERLDRLVKLKETCLEHEYHHPLRMLDQALYSTYWDCVQLGMRSQARQALGLSPTALHAEA